jgi:D-alanine transaminase
MIFPSTVFLNGQFISKDRAYISPDDRGFYFADGVYEVIKYYFGKPFRMQEHLARLKNSLNGIRISYPKTEELTVVGERLIDINRLGDGHAGIYLQITRGAAPRTHSFPGGDTLPSVYGYAFKMPPFKTEQENGIRVISREDIRWHRCNIKSITLLPNTMLFQEACEQNAFETLLVRDGFYTEATHSNVLFVSRGVIFTHPDSNLILPGITKSVVFEIAGKLGIKVIQEAVLASETDHYEECFITGTGSEIIPVAQVDDKIIGNGKPGPVTKALQKEFLEITGKISS